MAAESLYLRSMTFTAGTSWLKSYADGLRDNTIRLGRTRYTAGEVAIAQADAEIGALHVSSAKILRLYRQSGTGAADDATRAALSTPIRGVWHYNDAVGDPSSAASVTGDLLVQDDGSNPRFLRAYNGSAYYGLGVRADYRTAATAGTQTQDSDEIRMRGSSWKASSSAAKWRDVALKLTVDDAVDATDSTSLSVTFEGEDVSSRTPLTISAGGYITWLAMDASAFPVLAFGNGTGTRPDRALTVAPIGPTPDECEILFSHSNSARMARWVFSAEPVRAGVAAEVLAVQTETAATEESDVIDSPSIVHRGRYFDGDESQAIEAYEQLIVESTVPECSIRRGFSSGSGTFDFRNDGSGTFSGAVSADSLSATNDVDVGGNVDVEGDVSCGLMVFTHLARAGTPSSMPTVFHEYAKTLSSGSVTWDVSGDVFGSVVGVIATRKGSGGGAVLEWSASGTNVTVSDGSGSSSDDVSVFVWGDAAS